MEEAEMASLSVTRQGVDLTTDREKPGVYQILSASDLIESF